MCYPPVICYKDTTSLKFSTFNRYSWFPIPHPGRVPVVETHSLFRGTWRVASKIRISTVTWMIGRWRIWPTVHVCKHLHIYDIISYIYNICCVCLLGCGGCGCFFLKVWLNLFWACFDGFQAMIGRGLLSTHICVYFLYTIFFDKKRRVVQK